MSITESDVAHGDSTELYLDPDIHRRRWWTLVVLCLSLMIVFIGNSSLNVAIPTLAEDFHATNSQLQWVVASYSLVFAGLLFTTGAIGDRFGRKGVLQLGLAGFLVGVVLASMATDDVAADRLPGAHGRVRRVHHAVDAVDPGQRVRPRTSGPRPSPSGPASPARAGAIGPVASGWLLGHFWFGSVFLVNVPFIAGRTRSPGTSSCPARRDPQHGDLDPIGAILSIIGVSSLVYGLIQAPEDGWASASTLIAFAVAAVVLAVFVAWEMHVEEPMLDMSFFRNPAFSTGTAGMILVFLAMFGVMFLITQYFQLVLGYSPLGASLRFLPMTPIMIVVAPLTPRMVARFGANRTVSFGLGLVALGFLLFRGLEIDTSYAYVLLCVFPLVAGIAMAMSPMTASLMSAVPARRAGVGSAMNDATRELGAALGVAVLGSVAASKYARSVDQPPRRARCGEGGRPRLARRRAGHRREHRRRGRPCADHRIAAGLRRRDARRGAVRRRALGGRRGARVPLPAGPDPDGRRPRRGRRGRRRRAHGRGRHRRRPAAARRRSQRGPHVRPGVDELTPHARALPNWVRFEPSAVAKRTQFVVSG